MKPPAPVTSTFMKVPDSTRGVLLIFFHHCEAVMTQPTLPPQVMGERPVPGPKRFPNWVVEARPPGPDRQPREPVCQLLAADREDVGRERGSDRLAPPSRQQQFFQRSPKVARRSA